MKSFFSLLLALVLIVVFGGAAFFLINASQGARFERLDQPAKTSE